MRGLSIRFGLLLFACMACSQKKKEPLLLATRKLPISWVTFEAYADKKFIYSTGRGDGDTGTYTQLGDTLFLAIKDSTFKIDKVVINSKSVNFIDEQDSNYQNGAEIIRKQLPK